MSLIRYTKEDLETLDKAIFDNYIKAHEAMEEKDFDSYDKYRDKYESADTIVREINEKGFCLAPAV